MSAESNFSFTTKVNGDLFTIRGDVFDDFLQNLVLASAVPEVARLANALDGTTPIPTAVVQAPSTASAIANIENSFGPVDVVSDREEHNTQQSASSLEEKMDKFGNKFVKGSPGMANCNHGPRIVKYGTSKAGKKYKAHVCLNDSPWGDWKQDKCETVWG